MKWILLIIILLIMIELKYKPRLDRLKNGKIILWYGNIVRKYKIIH